jgi:hypothetical protein
MPGAAPGQAARPDVARFLGQIRGIPSICDQTHKIGCKTPPSQVNHRAGLAGPLTKCFSPAKSLSYIRNPGEKAGLLTDLKIGWLSL